jgi:hypothetical protein
MQMRNASEHHAIGVYLSAVSNKAETAMPNLICVGTILALFTISENEHGGR